MKTMFKTFTKLLPLATMAAVVASAPAGAQIRSKAVSYAGLDLTTPAGQAILEQRVKAAVRDVCGSADIADLSEVRAQRDCRSQALASAMPKIELAAASARQRLASAERNVELAAAR